MRPEITCDLLVITSFPQKHKIHGLGTVGIASYAKNTLLSLLSYAQKHSKNIKITVLAEYLDDGDTACYEDSGLTVKRIWHRNKPLAFFLLFKTVASYRKTKKVLIEFEHAMFGSYLWLSLFPLLVFFFRLLGKEVILVSHQVLGDINDLSGHIGFKKNSITSSFINLLINIYYLLLFNLVNKTIVFEECLRKRVTKFTSRNKIFVIPHGVEQFVNPISHPQARDKLKFGNNFTVLYFGFIAWYKGTDWLIRHFGNSNRMLIVAGGENPNHKNKRYYCQYIEEIKRDADKLTDKIRITGFIDEEEIPLYFQACDVVVLPYRTLMSSSGPLSLALSFSKPFILSDNLSEIAETSDFKEAMEQLEMTKNDLFFSMEDNSMNNKLDEIESDKNKINILIEFSKVLGNKRNFEKIGEEYYQNIFT